MDKNILEQNQRKYFVNQPYRVKNTKKVLELSSYSKKNNTKNKYIKFYILNINNKNYLSDLTKHRRFQEVGVK